MSDDYLWDRSGKPDPVVQRLERTLGGLRHNRPAGEFPEAPRRRAIPSSRWRWGAALAAASLLIVIGGVAAWIRSARPFFEVAKLEGAPRIGTSPIGPKGRLKVGEALETDGSSRARIDIALIGQVDVDPDTRVGLVAAQAAEKRLSLERGTIHARIWAPPRLFFVDTPSATAIDLGCAYTLTVDSTGAGLLRVTKGWVAFDLGDREAFVPEGALCATRPGSGPGTPYREDATETLRRALAQLDFDGGAAAPGTRAAALGTVLEESRKQDALTLWHLLTRTEGDERGRVFDRLAELVPSPETVTREGILAGNPAMLDLWWNELGLRSASFWRTWEGPWPRR